MKCDINIVTMEHRHVEMVAKLEEVCFSQPWSSKAIADEVENPLGVFRVATDQSGGVVGYIGMHHVVGECYITNVAVFPEHRGQGIAKALVGHLIQWATERDSQFITLEVRPSNMAAISLYERLGFSYEGLRCNYYRNPPEDGVIMTKQLEIAQKST